MRSEDLGLVHTFACLHHQKPVWLLPVVFFSTDRAPPVCMFSHTRDPPNVVSSSKVCGKPIWEGVWPYLDSIDSVCLHTASIEWNVPLLPEVALPRLIGQDVVRREGATAGSLDGWVWRELKVLPVSWYDELARTLTKVEDSGVWPDGLLDAYIAMIPKTDGDATHLGQRPLSVLPVVYRIWASVRMDQFDVLSAGGGRSSVEAWKISALDIEEVLTGATDSDVHLFVADFIHSFDTVWIGF